MLQQQNISCVFSHHNRYYHWAYFKENNIIQYQWMNSVKNKHNHYAVHWGNQVDYYYVLGNLGWPNWFVYSIQLETRVLIDFHFPSYLKTDAHLWEKINSR